MCEKDKEAVQNSKISLRFDHKVTTDCPPQVRPTERFLLPGGERHQEQMPRQEQRSHVPTHESRGRAAPEAFLPQTQPKLGQNPGHFQHRYTSVAACRS